MGDDKRKASEISNQINVSKSTVSKALNNCSSVNPETKLAILKAAKELQYTPAQKLRIGKKNTAWTIGVVMPINPHYFWGSIIEGIKAAGQHYPEIRVVFSLFANLSSKQDALYCLEYLQDLQIDLLVVTPPAFSEIHDMLNEIAKAIPVVCLNETAGVPFQFYVGANFYQDGVRLARACAQTLRKHPNIVQISERDLPMVHKREEGFHRETEALVPEVSWIGTVQMETLPVSTLSAQIAAILHEQYGGMFQSVYVSQGFLPQVCLALKKLKLTESIAVFGYENPKQNDRYISLGMISAFIEQDTYRQGYCCMEAVAAYLTEGRLPDNRCLYVPSRLYAQGWDAGENT